MTERITGVLTTRLLPGQAISDIKERNGRLCGLETPWNGRTILQQVYNGGFLKHGMYSNYKTKYEGKYQSLDNIQNKYLKGNGILLIRNPWDALLSWRRTHLYNRELVKPNVKKNEERKFHGKGFNII